MTRVISAALAAAVLASGASAQEGLTLESLKTYAYESMVSWHERDTRAAGVTEVAQVEGMIFLDIRAVFDVPWTEELSRLSVSSRDIKLTLPDGTEIESFGAYDYWGMMEMIPEGISISRPRDFPDEDEDLYWHTLYLVPEGTTTATLTIPSEEGQPGWTGEIEVPAVSEEQDAAMFAEFTITDVERYRVIALEDGRESRRVTSTITAPEGQVLVDLEVEILAYSANEFEADGDFHWHTYDFRLTGPDGESFWPVGERFSSRILDWQFNGVNVGESARRRMVWTVPEGVSAATLRFGETPVAEVDLNVAVEERG